MSTSADETVNLIQPVSTEIRDRIIAKTTQLDYMRDVAEHARIVRIDVGRLLAALGPKGDMELRPSHGEDIAFGSRLPAGMLEGTAIFNLFDDQSFPITEKTVTRRGQRGHWWVDVPGRFLGQISYRQGSGFNVRIKGQNDKLYRLFRADDSDDIYVVFSFDLGDPRTVDELKWSSPMLDLPTGGAAREEYEKHILSRYHMPTEEKLERINAIRRHNDAPPISIEEVRERELKKTQGARPHSAGMSKSAVHCSLLNHPLGRHWPRPATTARPVVWRPR